MWRENKGFSTIETMSALSLWLFLLLTVVPLWDKLIADENMAESREIGYQVMNESISKYMMTGEGTASVTKNNTFYTLKWEEEGEYQNVCISAAAYKEKAFCLSILRTDWLYAS
ncbi:MULTISPECIES: competence type IV pilus minor pilin ComGE [unclassified Bacillus (in: firmicutes)]|uniref:competence type IV pilus minor pilin ComGE n=1 Tax=unclassified Bacillus (in: firmicutes) TaxID=185979 RepID=UPI002282EC79|nr:competence protein ComG [Bacillus sp. S20C3]MCY8205111.1 competence protein ComG [Bacillus sp. N12A5]MCY8289528.1 competence protein ComG [Bacillus sp. N13C7]MCY8638015.1 competence protein ComG [Bacillus sp. S17B2]MCY9144218.1 competence protein ComG [Bacillus sp. T9C1]